MDTNTLNKAKELIGKIESLHNELSDLFTGIRYKANTVGVIPQLFVSSSPRPGLKYGKEDAPKKTKKTRNMTPEGRAAISAAAKKRWAAWNKAQKARKIT